MGTARVLDRVDIKGLVVDQEVCVSVGIPVLSPQKISHLSLRQPLLPGVVDPLDDGTWDARHLKQVRYCGAMTKWVDGPSRLGSEAQVVLHPLVSCNRTTGRFKTSLYIKLYLKLGPDTRSVTSNSGVIRPQLCLSMSAAHLIHFRLNYTIEHTSWSP